MPSRRHVAKGFTRNCGRFLSARQRLPLPTSSLGTTDSCSQGRILLLKLCRARQRVALSASLSPADGRAEPESRNTGPTSCCPRGDDTMRYTIVLLLLLLGMTASDVGTLMERSRLAQNQTFAECVSNCNSNNFSCAQNCGLSGACVAQCTATSAACKNGCSRLK
jgi:hypothetical protein